MDMRDCVFEETLETCWHESSVASHCVSEAMTRSPGNQNQPVEVRSWGLHPKSMSSFCLGLWEIMGVKSRWQYFRE